MKDYYKSRQTSSTGGVHGSLEILTSKVKRNVASLTGSYTCKATNNYSSDECNIVVDWEEGDMSKNKIKSYILL